MPSFHIITFGCQMNAGDSDWMRRTLSAGGLTEAERHDQADVYIVNTCSVRDKPEQKVYSELGRIERFLHVQRRKALICVGGCVAQQIGDRLFRRFPNVRMVFGPGGVHAAPEAVFRLLEEPQTRLSFLDFPDAYQERRLNLELKPFEADLSGGRQAEAALGKAPVSTLVTIMQGCDNFCAYCIVPYVRGRQKSRETTDILQECRELVAHGSKEITLLGQNVNSFGQDRKTPGASFAELLYEVAALPGLERLRFLTPHPKDIAERVIQAFAELPNLAPRLHLPLQSGSDRILKAMGRKYDLPAYMKIVENLRAARPEIFLSTDIIVGFPGETEEDFQNTMSALKAMDCAFSFSFAYSDRPGTRAEKMPDKVDPAVAAERLARLQSWQNGNTEALLRARVGETCLMLAEDVSLPPPSTQKTLPALQGKDERGVAVNVELAPEVNGEELIGRMLPVKIIAAGRHSLKGQLG